MSSPSNSRVAVVKATRGGQGASMAVPLVYIVEDEPAVIDTLVLWMSARGIDVRAFLSAAAFRAALGAQPAGCVLLDVGLPGMDGLSVQAELIERGILLPVVFMTGHGNVSVARTAFRNGAVDLLEKPLQEDAVLAAVRVALRRDERRRAWEAEAADVHTLMCRLTVREREVLSLLCEGHPTREVARALGVSPRTVESHRANLMGKLNATSLVDLLRMRRAVRDLSPPAAVT